LKETCKGFSYLFICYTVSQQWDIYKIWQ